MPYRVRSNLVLNSLAVHDYWVKLLVDATHHFVAGSLGCVRDQPSWLGPLLGVQSYITLYLS